MSDLNFDKSSRQGFQEYVNENIKEGEIDAYENHIGNFVGIEIDTPTSNNQYRLYFYDVKLFLAVKGSEGERSDEIQSLSVEEDYSRFYDSPHLKRDDIESYLYVLLRTKSGDELHIVSEIVYITVF